MEDNHVRYDDIEDDGHITDTIVDLYSPDSSGEPIAKENENEGIFPEGRTAFALVQRSASTPSLSVSPSPLSTMPLENIDFEAPATIVAQERNNIQALKRISLDASSTSDPDLPAAGIALLQHGPTSPPSTSPPSAPSGGNPQAFPVDDTNSSQPDGPLLWVPAHLHPELAPKEWRTFVQERVAEIQQRTGAATAPLSETASSSYLGSSGTLLVPGSAGATGTGIVRRKSKLSREIDISDDGYEDGADVLQERAKAKSPEVTVSALEWLEAYGRKTRSANSSPDLPGGVVISDGNVIAPLQNGRGLRRSQHTSRKNKRLVEAEERLPVTSEEADEENENSVERNLNIEGPSGLTSAPPLFDVPDRGPQVTVTDGKLQLNINETDLGSLDIDTDVVIEAAKFVDIPDVAVAPDSVHQSSTSTGTFPGHTSSCSTSSSSTVSTVSSTSTAKASPLPEVASPTHAASLLASVGDHRSTSPSATPTKKLSSTYRQFSRLTSKRATADVLTRSSSSPNLSADSARTQGPPTKPIAPITTTSPNGDISTAVSGDPKGRTDEPSLMQASVPSTSVHQAPSPQPGPSLKKRGKALTAGFGRLFSSDKDKAKDKERALGRKNSAPVSLPSRSDRASDHDQYERFREAVELERPSTPNTEMEKRSIKSSKESKLSSFFGAKKKALTKGNGASRSPGPQDKKKKGDTTKHVRTSRSSSSLSSTYTDRYAAKSQSQSSSPSPSRAQFAQGSYGRPYYYSRFPLHVERAIYRLSHLKLANPRRPLCQQVLLSNFMYSYLELINQDSMYGYQQQQYAYQQQQYAYQQQLQMQRQAYMQNLQLQMYQQQTQNLWNRSQQQPLHKTSYPDEENMFAGMESSPAFDRQIHRPVNTPAVVPKSDDVDTYWQDSDSDDDVYGTYFDDTEDDYPAGPAYEDGHFEDAIIFGDRGSFKQNSNSRSGSQLYMPAETYYETISRQQKEQADRAQYEQQAASKSSTTNSFNGPHPQTLTTNGGGPRYQSSSSSHQHHTYNGYANYYYGAERQAQVVGGFYRD
ncbi:hypothetical protein V1525DRAFT_179667 [Lipomyces kononenkoae]|uniref:Uncharacterized protein n=1 Tax=Lipomyces kononenkoae TaxID=34357 RepID=A0ACC3T9S1_LIPKO